MLVLVTHFYGWQNAILHNLNVMKMIMLFVQAVRGRLASHGNPGAEDICIMIVLHIRTQIKFLFF